MSAFFLYSQANRPRVKEENPDAAFGDLVSHIVPLFVLESAGHFAYECVLYPESVILCLDLTGNERQCCACGYHVIMRGAVFGVCEIVSSATSLSRCIAIASRCLLIDAEHRLHNARNNGCAKKLQEHECPYKLVHFLRESKM